MLQLQFIHGGHSAINHLLSGMIWALWDYLSGMCVPKVSNFKWFMDYQVSHYVRIMVDKQASLSITVRQPKLISAANKWAQFSEY